MTTSLTATPEFFGTPVRIIDHAGQRWLTAEEIGLCLGYNEANAGEGIRKLYNRHEDEFTAADSCRVNLSRRDGKTSEMLIFSATGCQLLGFFSNTERAKQFRAWAKQVLAGTPAVAVERPPIRIGPVKITRTIERDVLTLFVQGMAQAEIARYLRISKTSTNRLVLAQHRFEPNAGSDMTTPELRQAVVDRHMEIERARLAHRYCASAANGDLAVRLDDAGVKLLGRD